MDSKALIDKISQQETLNFLLTNYLPRRLATQFIGWFSRIENPIIKKSSIFLWKCFADDLKLHEAKKKDFNSLHDCFIRELKKDARTIDPDPKNIISPCDAILGAHGKVEEKHAVQVKGFIYPIAELFKDDSLEKKYQEGYFLTLRLKSNMYHRFHAPCALKVRHVQYISGDTWNVNPPALKRIQKLFCKNERAIIDVTLDDPDASITMVPVAAILVASLRLNFINNLLNMNYSGPTHINCDATFEKGQEMGYFHQGSTIILFANKKFKLKDNLKEGMYLKMGEPLLVKIN